MAPDPGGEWVRRLLEGLTLVGDRSGLQRLCHADAIIGRRFGPEHGLGHVIHRVADRLEGVAETIARRDEEPAQVAAPDLADAA